MDKCIDCYLRYHCDEQTEFICKHNDYCKYIGEGKDMKFEDKYPDMKPKKTYESMLCCEDTAPCKVCGSPTHFIDYCYEMRVCSEECLKKLDDEITEMCRDK